MQRRMESALVRRDSVMLHDPMRTHIRAGIVGLCLAMVAVAGVFIFGFFTPRDALPTTDGIVIGAESSATYVLLHTPSTRLIPVTNLASARLILIRQAGAADAGSTATARPDRISDDVLRGIPREPLAGIPGAPADIPTGAELVEPRWSLCDRTEIDSSLPASVQLDRARITSTAVIGLDERGRRLRANEAMLVRSAHNGQHYLVYQGKRAAVDLADPAVVLALNLDAQQADRRPVSTGLLNAIPEIPALVVPEIADRNQLPAGYRVDHHRVGDVVRTGRAEGDKFYVLLRSGRQEISRSVANLIQARNTRNIRIPDVAAGTITAAPEAAEADRIRVQDYPEDVPTVVPARQSAFACLYWIYQDGRQQTAITVADGLVLPDGQRPVRLAQADGGGDLLDEVFVPPGMGASVRAVVAGQPPETGTIYLVTDLGTRFGVPSIPTATSGQLAAALGLSDLRPAPQAILRLLPSGAALDPGAIRTFDTVPGTG